MGVYFNFTCRICQFTYSSSETIGKDALICIPSAACLSWHRAFCSNNLESRHHKASLATGLDIRWEEPYYSFREALKKEKRYYREAIADAPKLLHPLLLYIYSVHLLLYLSYILQYSKNKLIHIVLSTIHVYYLYIILYTKWRKN